MGRKLDEDDVIRVMHERIVGVSESRAKIVASYVPTAEPTASDCWKCNCREMNRLSRPAPFTDKEKRIFLSAMGREEKVCKQVDEECRDCREPYEDTLVSICREIVRKVKGTLWKI